MKLILSFSYCCLQGHPVLLHIFSLSTLHHHHGFLCTLFVPELLTKALNKISTKNHSQEMSLVTSCYYISIHHITVYSLSSPFNSLCFIDNFPKWHCMVWIDQIYHLSPVHKIPQPAIGASLKIIVQFDQLC